MEMGGLALSLNLVRAAVLLLRRIFGQTIYEIMRSHMSMEALLVYGGVQTHLALP